MLTHRHTAHTLVLAHRHTCFHTGTQTHVLTHRHTDTCLHTVTRALRQTNVLAQTFLHTGTCACKQAQVLAYRHTDTTQTHVLANLHARTHAHLGVKRRVANLVRRLHVVTQGGAHEANLAAGRVGSSLDAANVWRSCSAVSNLPLMYNTATQSHSQVTGDEKHCDVQHSDPISLTGDW